jgi:cytoskeletal protein CcmA (bactofilin family)
MSGKRAGRPKWKRWIALFLWIGAVAAVGLWLAPTAWAAELRGGGDLFRLPAGEVINDDLYVGAGEIFIDGTVEGDLVAAGGYIEVNGEVTGDVILAGGGLVINGRVGDDARLAGGGITVAGSIGDDLFIAGGGPGWPGIPAFPMRIGERTIAQGVRVASSATINGDVYVVGGQGMLDGTIDGDLFAGMGAVTLGGTVGGDARLDAGRVEVQPNSQVAGVLRYDSDDPTTIPQGVAATIIENEPVDESAAQAEQPNLAWRVVGWLWRTFLIVLGFALLVWLVWRLAPGLVRRAEAGVRTQPVQAMLYGLLIAAFFLPLLIALVALAWIFWGAPAGLAAAFGLLGLMGLLWLLSPLFSGYWLGQQLAARKLLAGDLTTFLVGVLTIVLVARLLMLIPFVGFLFAGLIYLLSFALTVGGWLAARQPQAVMVGVTE